MRKDLVQKISQMCKIVAQDQIEKDMIIHEILTDLSKDEFFVQNILFKGGTCLSKTCLEYARFSEDIDFTWKDQAIFQGKSNKQLRRDLSVLIARIAEILKDIAQRRGLDFKYEKANPRYVELGGSNKMCTYRVWYKSEIIHQESFLKVQINFVECLLYPPRSEELSSLGTGDNSGDLSMMFKDSDYLTKIRFPVYDPKEILCEKIRAIMTRKETKARDFVDTFLIYEKLGIAPKDVKDEAIKKIDFVLEYYEKYRNNIKEKAEQIERENFFELGDEERILLQKMDMEKFHFFAKKMREILRAVSEKYRDS